MHESKSADLGTGIESVLVVGVTGGVGSGKTTVSRFLQEQGAYVIEADLIAREVVEPQKPAWREIRKTFGDEVIAKNGSIDRKKLAEVAFGSRDNRLKLEAIIHPKIEAEIERRIGTLRKDKGDAIVVIDGALLIETGAYKRMDCLVVVTATEEQQVERYRRRTGASEQCAKSIVSAQMSHEERLRAANFVIRNEGSLEDLKERVKELFLQLKRLAQERPENSKNISSKEEPQTKL